MLYYICKILVAPFLYIYWRPKTYNKHNLKVKGKAIIVANHQNLADPIMIGVISVRPIHFMAKQDLFKNKIVALAMKSFLAFPVNRKNADLKSIKKAKEVLDSGKIFGIFPEGKRSATTYMDEFEKGAAFLAARSLAPIIPIYISPESFFNHKVKINVGKHIDIEEMSKNLPKSELVDAINERILDSMYELKKDLETYER